MLSPAMRRRTAAPRTNSFSGVRILSAPDAAGEFDFERATQQIGGGWLAAFLAPHRREDRLVTAGH